MSDSFKMQFDLDSPWGKWRARGAKKLALQLISGLPVNSMTRRLAFLFRKPIKEGSQEFYDVALWGLKLRLSAKGNLTEQRWLTMPNFHDYKERRFIERELKSGGVFIDVGANAGFYSLWALSRENPSVRVVAVEPNPGTYERLQFNVSLNGLEPRLNLMQTAVTAQPREVVIDRNLENLGQTKVSDSGSGLKVEGVALLEVLNRSKVHKPKVLKIDIEGGEAEVLRSFFEDADSSRWPVGIIGEIFGSGGDEFSHLLKSEGYLLEDSTKMNGIFKLKGTDG